MRKYSKGELIKSLDELVQQEFVYWNDKITHKGWVAGWQIHTALIAIKYGKLCKAIKNEEDK